VVKAIKWAYVMDGFSIPMSPTQGIGEVMALMLQWGVQAVEQWSS